MSAIAEKLAETASICEHTNADHMLALVQGDMVISTFPEDQTDAAIDLARVLCRALAQPVDIYRIPRSGIDGVQAGAIAHSAEPGWVRLAHLHVTFPVGVNLEICDPVMQASQQSMP